MPRVSANSSYASAFSQDAELRKRFEDQQKDLKQTNKRFEEAQGRKLRTVTISGARALRFSDILIMCLRVSNDTDTMIWVKKA